jgi:hypothetical protein
MGVMKQSFLKSEQSTSKNKVIHKLEFQVSRADMHISLPNLQLYMLMNGLRTQWNGAVEHRGKLPATAIRIITVYGIAPHIKSQWDQTLEMDNMRFLTKKDVHFSTSVLCKTNQLSLSKMYLGIPYGYEVSHMAADRSSLLEATKKIVDLQNRSRQLIHARDQYRPNIELLDEKHIDELCSIRLVLQDTQEELYLDMEANKLIQSNQRKDYHEPKTNLKFVNCHLYYQNH